MTATIGATTTVCPLTFSQARLSRVQALTRPTGGPLETSTTTWPTVYNLPSSFATYSWDPAIWASIFPEGGAPAFTDPVSTGTFADGEWTGTPFPLPTLNAEQAALFGGDGSASSNVTGGSFNGSSGAGGAGDAGSSGQSVTVTTGSFAAIFSSNMTAYVTTLNAFTGNWSAGGSGATGGAAGVTGGGAGATGGASGATGGVNGSLPGSPTTLSNGTVVGTGPVSLQTVNVSPAIPVNIFSLLVALSALAFAL